LNELDRAPRLEDECKKCGDSLYNTAEATGNDSAVAGLVGGALFGASVGGAPGAIIGGIVGGIIGKNA
jgi:hypothetical protein